MFTKDELQKISEVMDRDIAYATVMFREARATAPSKTIRAIRQYVQDMERLKEKIRTEMAHAQEEPLKYQLGIQHFGELPLELLSSASSHTCPAADSHTEAPDRSDAVPVDPDR